MGAVYNGFSLNEHGAVANAIEKVGQAVDASYTETAQMVRDLSQRWLWRSHWIQVTSLEGEFAEPIQEHSQFAQIVKQVLRFRHLKHAQVEMIESSLESKKDTLENLQEMENEARRLEEAISRERTVGANAVDIDELNRQQQQQQQQNGQEEEPTMSNGHQYPTSNGHSNPYARDHAHQPSMNGNGTTTVLERRRSNKTWSSPARMINAVGHSLQGFIDVDPEATRRNQIGKTKDAMEVVNY